MQGKLFLVDTTSPKSLTSLSSLPHLHICCSFSLLEKPSQFPETESKPHSVLHKGAEHKETGNVEPSYYHLHSDKVSPCFHKSQIALETSLAWMWACLAISNYFGYM